MGWQKRLSGRRHESTIGQVFIISGIPKYLIGAVLYLKACQKCDAADKRAEESEYMSAQRTLKEALKVWRLLQL